MKTSKSASQAARKHVVLSDTTRAYAKRVSSSPEESREFLQRAGIATPTGKLTSRYR